MERTHFLIRYVYEEVYTPRPPHPPPPPYINIPDMVKVEIRTGDTLYKTYNSKNCYCFYWRKQKMLPDL